MACYNLNRVSSLKTKQGNHSLMKQAALLAVNSILRHSWNLEMWSFHVICRKQKKGASSMAWWMSWGRVWPFGSLFRFNLLKPRPVYLNDPIEMHQFYLCFAMNRSLRTPSPRNMVLTYSTFKLSSKYSTTCAALSKKWKQEMWEENRARIMSTLLWVFTGRNGIGSVKDVIFFSGRTEIGRFKTWTFKMDGLIQSVCREGALQIYYSKCLVNKATSCSSAEAG